MLRATSVSQRPPTSGESGYEPGIVDDLDAAQQADMAPYLARNLSRKRGYVAATDISASVMFAAAAEPWVYCASIAPTRSYGVGSLGALKREFAESKGSDAAITAIDNPRQFARRLGIELALSIVGRKPHARNRNDSAWPSRRGVEWNT